MLWVAPISRPPKPILPWKLIQVGPQNFCGLNNPRKIYLATATAKLTCVSKVFDRRVLLP